MVPSLSPEDSAREVQIAYDSGYRGLKCKARAFYDVIEQTQAMQSAVPDDFRIEFDFNGALISVEKALPILKELEQYPVVKGVEEPIFASDITGWQRLHAEVRIPIYLHGVRVLSRPASREPSGPWTGLRSGDFEGALCSHESIGNALAAAWTFSAANTPILLQYVGTGITTALSLQLGAVMPTATLPGVTASHTYCDDLIETKHEIQRGMMRVPDGPGLGVVLDETALTRFSGEPKINWSRHISVVNYHGGTEHYYRDLQQAERLMKQGADDSFAPHVYLHEWEDDGSARFNAIWARLQETDWPIFETRGFEV